MRSEIKAIWLDALRSGGYQQDYGQLERNGKFCCLGVLCDLAKDFGIVRRLERAGDRIIFEAADESGVTDWSSTSLPDAVQNWAGIDRGDPGVPALRDAVMPDGVKLTGTVSLGELNDSQNYDFNAIADIIEEQL